MKAQSGKVVRGDCIKGLAAMAARSVDLVFADPPFNIGYKYDEYDDRQDHEEYLAWSRDWMRAVYRVLKPNGTFWLAIGDEYAAELKLIAQNGYAGLPLLDDEAAKSAPTEPPRAKRRRGRQARPPPEPTARGFHCRNWVIWYYTFGVHCTRKFTRSHAHLLYFVKDPKDFTFNPDAIRVPSARQLVYADKRANPKGRMPDDTWLIPVEPQAADGAAVPTRAACGAGVSPVIHRTPESQTEGNAGSNRRRGARPKAARSPAPTFDGFNIRPQDLPDGFTPGSDTWYFSRVAGTFSEREGWHGCQMPEQLLGRIIRACSNEGDLVLDPFTGSGTTVVAAKKLGRRYAGVEVSEEYAKYARRRLAAVQVRDCLTGAQDPLLNAVPTARGRSIPTSEEQASFGFGRKVADAGGSGEPRVQG